MFYPASVVADASAVLDGGHLQAAALLVQVGVTLHEWYWVADHDCLSEALDAAVQRAALAARLRVQGRRAKRPRDVLLAAEGAIRIATARLAALRPVHLPGLRAAQHEAECLEEPRAVPPVL
jgi:hypothetical protein